MSIKNMKVGTDMWARSVNNKMKLKGKNGWTEEACLLGCYQSMRRDILEESSRQQSRWPNLGSRKPEPPQILLSVKISKTSYTAFQEV